jgi:hypothetical protein
VVNINDDLLLVPDPNGWIKNVEISLDGQYQHRIAMCLFTDENLENSTAIQSFNFFLDHKEFNEEHVEMFHDLAHKLFPSMAEDFEGSSKALILVIHDDLVVARQIMGSILHVPAEFDFPTVAAFITDRVTWEDILLSRNGIVDSTIITDFQLNKILHLDNNGKRFSADGTPID